MTITDHGKVRRSVENRFHSNVFGGSARKKNAAYACALELASAN